MIKTGVKGLDEFNRTLRDFGQRLEELGGTHNIPLPEILTDAFVSKHTKFSSLNVMIEASGFKVDTPEDFAAILGEEWDGYIRSVSSFDSWRSMLGEAAKEWTLKRLGFDAATE